VLPAGQNTPDLIDESCTLYGSPRVVIKSSDMRHASGFLRLGIVLTATWLIVFPVFYWLVLSGFYSHRKLAYALGFFYTWIEDATVTDTTVGFVPIIPQFNFLRFVSFWVLPLVICWLVLFVLPRAIRWVVDGFRNE
jgi:hypothetical protein